jgi:hypothetical protein
MDANITEKNVGKQLQKQKAIAIYQQIVKQLKLVFYTYRIGKSIPKKYPLF